MRHLSNKVNIVPVIAKADCLTQTEIGALKQKILQEIRDNDIKIYSLPECDRYASPLLRLLNNEPCTKKVCVHVRKFLHAAKVRTNVKDEV